MAELLIEFLCEEIPARMQAKAASDLGALLVEQLTGRGLSFSRYQTFASPRRLAIVMSDVPARQEAVREEKRGPRVDAPSAAIEGFLQSLNAEVSGRHQQRHARRKISERRLAGRCWWRSLPTSG